MRQTRLQALRGTATVILIAILCSHPAAQRRAIPAPGVDPERALTHDGRRRSYLVHVPTRAAPEPRPLLLAFHGGGGSAAGLKRYAGLDALADRENFVVAYPNGTGPLRTMLLTFNAGPHCCGPALKQNVDDVGFAAAVIEDVARQTAIDRRRVYVTGHSNGAIMAYRLAAERADLIAAIAPVAGAMSVARFAPSRAVAVLHIHSVDDPRALYDGGIGPPFPGTDTRVTHAPVIDGLSKWAARNGCGTQPTADATRHGIMGQPDATDTVTRVSYAPCTSGSDIVHLKLTGAGHGWPGAPRTERERIAGPGTTIINAAEEIWRFVSRFSR